MQEGFEIRSNRLIGPGTDDVSIPVLYEVQAAPQQTVRPYEKNKVYERTTIPGERMNCTGS